MDQILNGTSSVILILACLCTLVIVITQLTKDIGFLKKIPTKIEVMFVSEIVTMTTYFGATSHYNHHITWYEIIASFFLGLVVSFVSVYGWDSLFEVFTRFYKKK